MPDKKNPFHAIGQRTDLEPGLGCATVVEVTGEAAGFLSVEAWREEREGFASAYGWAAAYALGDDLIFDEPSGKLLALLLPFSAERSILVPPRGRRKCGIGVAQ